MAFTLVQVTKESRKQFTVFARAYNVLEEVGTVFAVDAAAAVSVWDEEFGDNYGKVVILPYDFAEQHRGVESWA